MRTLAQITLVCVFAISLWHGAATLAPAQVPPTPVAKNPTAPPAADAEQPFTATFSNGVKVQLIGLNENPSRGKAWWAPDGTRLEKPPYARVPAISHAGEGQIAREICWRWINTPEDPNFETRWHTVPPYFSAGGGRAFDDLGNEVAEVIAWAVGLDTPDDVCNLRFSATIANTPWTTIFSHDQATLTAMTRTIDGEPHGVIFAEPRRENGGTSITLTYQVPGKAVRLIAVDREGLVDEGSSKGGGALGFMQKTYLFANLPPEKIARYELQSQKREFEMVEFRNVSLYPDKRTNVEIVRLTAEDATRIPKEAPDAKKLAQSAAVEAAETRSQRATELVAALSEKYGYRLEPNQPLKRIGPPYAKERDELWALNTSYNLFRSNGAAAPTRIPRPEPGFMVMRWTQGELQPHSYHFREPSLADVLNDVFNLKTQDLQGDFSFLKMPVPGDWVVSWKPGDHRTNSQEIAALERILRDERKLPIRLKLQDVERPVFVATGAYKFSPSNDGDAEFGPLTGPVAERADGYIHIPLRRTNTSASVVTFPGLLHTIGEAILVPIVDEVAQRPKKESFFLRFDGPYATNPLAPFEESQIDDLLASITRQTGLRFKKDKRAITTLVIEREAPEE